MTKNRKTRNADALKDVNNVEVTGSVSIRQDDANAIIDKSMDAIKENMLTEQIKP